MPNIKSDCSNDTGDHEKIQNKDTKRADREKDLNELVYCYERSDVYCY